MNAITLIRSKRLPVTLSRGGRAPVKLVANRGPLVFVSGGNEQAVYLAQVPILDSSLVALIGGQLVPYDATRREHAYALLGMALNSADPGQTVRVQRAGEITYDLGGLVPGQTYLAGPAGRWQTGRAGLVFSHKVLRAVTPNLLQFLSQPIYFLS